MADASYDPHFIRSLNQTRRIGHMERAAIAEYGQGKLAGYLFDLIDALLAADESERYWLDIVSRAWRLPSGYPHPGADWDTYDLIMDELRNVPQTASLAKFYSAATQLKTAFEKFEERWAAWQESGLLTCYYMGCAWVFAFPPEYMATELHLKNARSLWRLRMHRILCDTRSGMPIGLVLGNEPDYPLVMTCGGQGDFTGYSAGEPGVTVAPQPIGSIAPDTFGGHSIKEISTRVESQLYVTIEGRRQSNFFSAIKVPAIPKPIQTSFAKVVRTDTHTRWTWDANLATLPASGEVQVILFR